MLLSGNTLVNLYVTYMMVLIAREIYQNQTDGSVYGSLLWLLDQ
jgi:hypothetical protein